MVRCFESELVFLHDIQSQERSLCWAPSRKQTIFYFCVAFAPKVTSRAESEILSFLLARPRLPLAEVDTQAAPRFSASGVGGGLSRAGWKP